jgi:hypothetical protein
LIETETRVQVNLTLIETETRVQAYFDTPFLNFKIFLKVHTPSSILAVKIRENVKFLMSAAIMKGYG